MPSRPDLLYWDSCVFLSYINGDVDRLPIIDALLIEAQAGKVHIVTSVLTIAEVVFAAQEQENNQLAPEVVDQIESILNDRRVVTLVDVTPAVARRARELQRNGKFSGRSIKPMDALHLATAATLSPAPLKIHTYDSTWPRWADALELPIVEPLTDAPILL